MENQKEGFYDGAKPLIIIGIAFALVMVFLFKQSK